jgi:signal transduction histidine kinase
MELKLDQNIQQQHPEQLGFFFSENWLNLGVAVINQSLNIQQINDELVKWLGRTKSDWVGCNFINALASKCSGWSDPLTKFFQKREDFDSINLINEINGKSYHYILSSTWSNDSCFITIRSTLPPRLELEEEGLDSHLRTEESKCELFRRLLRAESQIEILMQSWPGIIFSQRPDFTFHHVSPRIEQLTGIPLNEWRHNPQAFWSVIHEVDAEDLRRQLAKISKTTELSNTWRIRNFQTGKISYVLEQRKVITSSSGLIIGFEGAWLDITRQTIAEKRLSYAAWKETLAVITTGLAHDFSNIMAGIHSLSESFLSQIDQDHPFREGLNLIRKHSLQASQLIHRIINLHKGKIGERSYHDFNEIVKEAVDLVSKIIPRTVKLEYELLTEAVPVFVDPVEANHTIINLSLNAIEAMPKGGTLKFRTFIQHTNHELPFHVGKLTRFPAVCLEITDTGNGIKESQLKAIFDPFFTTKSVNKGSGLGLYNARLFAEKHQGAISVVSTEGKGSTFGIWVPQANFSEAERSQAASYGKRHTLMLIGDAGEHLDGLAEFLRTVGYYVVVAASDEIAKETLISGEYLFNGVFVVIESKDKTFSNIIDHITSNNNNIRSIIQIRGVNQDEIDPKLIERVDLVLPPEAPFELIQRKLERLLSMHSS